MPLSCHHMFCSTAHPAAGQEIIARKYMATAAVEGHWVLLQNTHLGLSYLAEVGS